MENMKQWIVSVTSEYRKVSEMQKYINTNQRIVESESNVEYQESENQTKQTRARQNRKRLTKGIVYNFSIKRLTKIGTE